MRKPFHLTPGDLAVSAVEDRVILLLNPTKAILLAPMTVEETDILIAKLSTVRDIAAMNAALAKQRRAVT